MKTTEFMIAMGEMCKAYSGGTEPCTGKGGELCPLAKADCNCDLTIPLSVVDAEKIQAIVEKWKREQGGTNEEKFEQIFGITAMEFWTLSDVNAEKWLKQAYEKN